MESFATPYPLIFFDGEQEQDKGFVGIHSVLTFKRFQSLLSQKTGLPPNQLSAVFVCRKTLKGSEKKQRLPINGNTNFSILLNQHNPNRERDCYFLVSVRRSKKERKGSRKRGAESEMPDDWETNNYMSAVEGNGHISNPSMEETLSQVSAGSAETNASLLKSTFPKHHTDNGIDSSRATDNTAGRVILKRGNTSFLQRHAWNHGERQLSQQPSGFLPDEYVQLNSPRFAALRPEDQRDLNWKWEEAFPRVPRVKPREQWDLHASFVLPHNTTSQADADYQPYNSNMSFPEECGVGHSNLQRKGRLIDPYSHNSFRNGLSGDPQTRSPFRTREFLHVNRQKLSFLAPRTSYRSGLGPMNEVDGQRDHDAFFEGNSHLHYLEEGEWQKMPGASGALPDMQDTPIMESGVNEGHILFCQLCFECRRRNVTPIPFHWCVEDAVTNGFGGPSPAGPIGRRVKTFHIEVTA